MTDARSTDGKSQRSIPATLQGLTVLMTWVDDWSEAQGIASEQAYAVRLIVEEMSSNAIRYGYAEGTTGQITASLWRVDADTLALSVADDGCAFDPLKEVSAPDLEADLDDRQIGGLGVFFALNAAKDCSYERRDGLNIFEAKV